MTEEVEKKDNETIASEISLKATDDKMEVLLSCTDLAVMGDDFEENVRNRMRSKRITAKPDMIAIRRATSEAKKNKHGISKLKIAEGLQPIQSVDGKIEWTRDYFKSEYYVDPDTKKIDFKQKVGDPTVEKDELLVKVFRAKQGRNGRNVYGEAIIVPNPKDVNIKGGPNVYWDEEASGFKANCSGRVKMRGNTLDVNNVYIARNGINSETGNIKHNGQVIVDGDIDSDFKIVTTGDIEVRGLAYACDITCGGNLITKEGINGGPEKKILVRGDILTKYIQNTNVEAGGDITVNKEIYQCRVETKGEISCNEGRIVGGEVWATNGITVGEVGSKGDVKTVLVAGVDKEIQAKLQANREEIKRLKEMIKKLEVGFRKFKMNQQLLNNAQKEAMTEIQYKISEGEDELKRIEEENKKFMEELKIKAEARIKVVNIVYPGTVFRISDARHTVDQVLAGPLFAVYDRLKGEVVLTSEEEENKIKEEKTKTQIEAEVREKMEAEVRAELESKNKEEQSEKDNQNNNNDK